MSKTSQSPTRQWWRHGVCYQIWPTSFATSPDTKSPIGENPTGISGSIRGIIGKLDYIKSLGASYIWISPCYASPLKDQGYDISNYEEIHPSYGTVADIDELTKQVHDRDMKIILDLVVNHTSDQHRWFKESRKSKDNSFSDYYHWHEPRYTRSKSSKNLIRRPPNQWTGFFGGSAWTWCSSRQQYYLHLFLESMPDLNWVEQTTRDAIFKTSMEFWLKRGIDGFRIDTLGLYDKTFPLVKDEEKAEAFSKEDIQNAIPYEEAGEDEQEPFVFDLKGYCSGPRMHGFMQELRQKTTAQFGDQIMFVGENAPTNYADTLQYLDPATREEDIYFDFGLHTSPGPWTPGKEGVGTWDKSTMLDTKHVVMHSTDSRAGGRQRHPVSDLHYAERERMPTAPLPLAYMRQALMKVQSYISDHNRWCTLWLENHDVPRSISRFGHQGTDQSLVTMSGKLIAMLQTTLSGSLFLYQGQEIGMTNIPTTGPQKWDVEDLRDVWFIRKIQAVMDKSKGLSNEEATKALERVWGAFNVSGRDNARTPMQWTNGTNSGFCSEDKKPWMRLNKNDHDGVSVAEQDGQDGSLLDFWRHAIEVRSKYEDVLCYGKTVFLDNKNESVLSYLKETFDGNQKVLVVLNFSDEASDLPDVKAEIGVDGDVYTGSVILYNLDSGEGGKLKAWEGRVYQIS